MARLEGKIAVVTGGGRGIGRAVTIRLAQEGAAVAVNYRSDHKSATAVVDELTDHGHRAVAIQADVSDPDQTGQLMDQVAQTLGGRILLTSSVSARKSVFHHMLYAASKAAVEAMALNLAPELGQRGITINAIAPGGTITDMFAEAAPRYIHPDLPIDHDTAVRAMTALGRWAEPSEIAAAVAFLVSADASYITGRTIPVDGGFF